MSDVQYSGYTNCILAARANSSRRRRSDPGTVMVGRERLDTACLLPGISCPSSSHSQQLRASANSKKFATKVADDPFNVTSALEQSLIRECRASRHPERTREAANDHSHP